MPNHVLVTGAGGQLGQELQELVSSKNYTNKAIQFHFTDRSTLDINNKEALKNFIETHHIDNIVNCAAYTAVDKAEEEETLAFNVNSYAVKNLAELSQKYKIRLIHISTDYVFDGTSHIPIKEEDPVNPQGVYARSKREGEEKILKINPKGSLIIRTSWVYSTYGQNFVHTMIKLGKERDTLNVVSDQIGTPTYAKDLAIAILSILQTKTNLNQDTMIYHYSNEGACSWYDFAKAIFEISNINCNVSPIGTHQYPTPAKRPFYSILDKRKIKDAYGLDIPYWRDSVKSCLNLLDQS